MFCEYCWKRQNRQSPPVLESAGTKLFIQSTADKTTSTTNCWDQPDLECFDLLEVDINNDTNYSSNRQRIPEAIVEHETEALQHIQLPMKQLCGCQSNTSSEYRAYHNQNLFNCQTDIIFLKWIVGI